MRIINDITAMQRLAGQWRGARRKVGFVPTMGFLHAGHVALMREARRHVGPKGAVVVSIYVNPTQFAPTEDLAKYPRDLAGDTKLCRAAGVDVLFVPTDAAMYPQPASAEFSTFVVESKLSQTMEGASRPSHFRGVTTIVAKLFNIVQPTVAVFGQKDFQQAAVLQRMVRDLNFPLKMVIAPTSRDPDGLAKSSRNMYLTPEQREDAPILLEAIQLAQFSVAQCEQPVPSANLKKAIQTLIESRSAARMDYVEFFDPQTMESVKNVTKGTHIALAVFFGKTRLIDNARI